MTLYTLPNATGGVDEAVVGLSAQVPIFTPMFLFFIFGVVLLGGSTAQKKRSGTVDMPFWTVLASMSILITSLLLSIKPGLIQLQVLSIVVVITIFSGVWFFLDRNRNEF